MFPKWLFCTIILLIEIKNIPYSYWVKNTLSYVVVMIFGVRLMLLIFVYIFPLNIITHSKHHYTW